MSFNYPTWPVQRGEKKEQKSEEQEIPEIKVDYKYRRCYLDRQGNLIDPRTSWDDILKYYRKYRILLGVGRKSREFAASTPTGALKLILAKKNYKENKKKASYMERKDLKRKEKKRKKEKRKRVEEKGSSYLKWAHENN